MNLLKSPLRRSVAVLAGTVIGMAGAVAFAAPAMATHPTVTGTGTCVDPATKTWTVEWKATNTWPVDGLIKAVKTKPDAPLTGEIAVDKQLDKNSGNTLTSTQVISADVKEAWLKVAVKYPNHTGWQSHEATVPQPEEVCEAPTTPPTTTPPTTTRQTTPPAEEPGEPTPIAEADCDTLTLGLNNPEDGEDITLTFKTSKGETRELEVKAGEEKTTKFSATEGFSVEIGVKGVEGTTTVTWEQPEGCEGQGGGEELALTGAAAGGIAGGAGVLLVIGAGLFVMARRRKVKFTA